MLLSKDKAFYRRVLRLAGWIALQNVIVCFVSLIDNIMVGAYSQTALSGVALANQVQFLLQMLVAGVGEGMAVLAAQYWGAQKLGPIRQVVAIALRLGLLISLAFFAVSQLAPGWLLGLMAGDKAVVAEGAAYLRLTGYSYPFFCVGLVLVSAHRSMEKVAVGMAAPSLAFGLKLVLNWMLIFGNGGAPALGARGAAIATLAARALECGIILFYTYRMDRRLALRLRELWRHNRGLLADFRRVATPVILSGGSWGLAMGIQTAILGHLGSAVIAANSIATSLFQLISVVIYGVSSASAVVVGKAVGGDEGHRLKEYVNTLQALYLVVGLLSGAALFLCRDWIISLYVITPEAVRLARGFITILSVTILGSAYQLSCLAGIVRGGGNTGFVFYNDLIFMWGLVLPLSLLAAYVWKWNPLWVFFCLKSDQLSKCLVAAWQVNSYRWVKKVTREDVGHEAS